MRILLWKNVNTAKKNLNPKGKNRNSAVINVLLDTTGKTNMTLEKDFIIKTEGLIHSVDPLEDCQDMTHIYVPAFFLGGSPGNS